ncbi:SDR family NAD(P)-dependent oxidoreductase [Marinobacterium aestuariivivens]|uniref:SDR family NAD(P)-dependent oxidoreductase n=1 Tax=Marinobacterium aestuariivivens TaxID=1698799 RepID=A0ABW2A7E2_9GAMM
MNHENFTADWLELRGRVAVVTGAASGIGAAIASALVDAGARVALLDRDRDGVEALRRELAGRGEVIGLACDIGDEAQVRAAAHRVAEALGPCQALVNCAGVLRPAGIRDIDINDWEMVLRVNLTGAMLCSRTFVEPMLAAGAGSLVHVASVSAHHPQTFSGAYSPSKAGVSLLSKQIAAELGATGIRSNVVCPGMIRTALSESFYADPQIKVAREALTASKRIGRPQDIADAVLYLLSPRAAYINGAELVVDGGLECMLMDAIPRPGYSNLRETD